VRTEDEGLYTVQHRYWLDHEKGVRAEAASARRSEMKPP
jgi:hypothetical protein